MGNCFGKPKAKKPPKDKENEPQESATLPRIQEAAITQIAIPERIIPDDTLVQDSTKESVTPVTSVKEEEKTQSQMDDSIIEEILQKLVGKTLNDALHDLEDTDMIVYVEDDLDTRHTTEELISEPILSIDHSVDIIDENDTQSESSMGCSFSKELQKKMEDIRLETKTTVSDIPGSLNNSRRGSLVANMNEKYSTCIDGSRMTLGYQNLNESEILETMNQKRRASSVAYQASPARHPSFIRKAISTSDNLNSDDVTVLKNIDFSGDGGSHTDVNNNLQTPCDDGLTQHIKKFRQEYEFLNQSYEESGNTNNKSMADESLLSNGDSDTYDVLQAHNLSTLAAPEKLVEKSMSSTLNKMSPSMSPKKRRNRPTNTVEGQRKRKLPMDAQY